jgi:hypothetical protein
MIAMLSTQGTAVSEAALCKDHDTPQLRQRLAVHAPSDVVPDSWTDVKGNEFIVCSICGYNEHHMDEADPNENLRFGR